MKITRILHFSLLVAIATCSSALANSFIISDVDLDPEILPVVANHIRTHMNHPELHRLSQSDKQKLLSSLTELESLVANDGSSRKIRRLQGNINAIMASGLTKNEPNADVVCERVRPIGSKIPKTECRTRAERDAEAAAARRLIDRGARCPQPPCN